MSAITMSEDYVIDDLVASFTGATVTQRYDFPALIVFEIANNMYHYTIFKMNEYTMQQCDIICELFRKICSITPQYADYRLTYQFNVFANSGRFIKYVDDNIWRNMEARDMLDDEAEDNMNIMHAYPISTAVPFDDLYNILVYMAENEGIVKPDNTVYKIMGDILQC